MLISGVGTGKSFFYKFNSSTAVQVQTTFYKVVSDTGASAWLVGGATFHSTLHMPYTCRRAPPSHGVTQAKNSLTTRRFLIVDEMS